MTKEGNYGSPEEQMRIVFFFPGDIFFFISDKNFLLSCFYESDWKKTTFFPPDQKSWTQEIK